MDGDGSIESAVSRLREMNKEQPVEQEASGTEQEAETDIQESEITDDDNAVEVADSEESETPETAEGDQEDTESIDLDAEQLTQVFGIEEGKVSVDDEGKLKFKTNIDGEESEATLDQLLERYQKDAAITKRGMEIGEIKKSREKALNDFVQATNQHAQQFASILDTLKNVFIQPMDQGQLNELKEEDPGRYAQIKADQSDRERAYDYLVRTALEEVQNAQKTQEEEFQNQLKEFRSEQEKISKDRIPNFDKTFPQIQEYLKSNEFSEDDLKQISDSRLWNLAYKAMLHDKGIQGAKQKLVKKVPKLIKSGKKAVNQNIEQDQKLRKQLKESGKMQDAVALLRARRGG